MGTLNCHVDVHHLGTSLLYQTILSESQHTISWIYEVIKEICKQERKVKLSNLKEMERIVVYAQKNGYDTRDDLLHYQNGISEKRKSQNPP